MANSRVLLETTNTILFKLFEADGIARMYYRMFKDTIDKRNEFKEKYDQIQQRYNRMMLNPRVFRENEAGLIQQWHKLCGATSALRLMGEWNFELNEPTIPETGIIATHLSNTVN